MVQIPLRRAYSYLRFSSPEQAHGDSTRRQDAAAEQWCAKRAHEGIVLDESLRMVDKGISAYRGKNASVGLLGAFLRAVESGEVPRGSFLLVEALDRLSREQVSVALETFLKLTRNGISIVTLKDGMVYSSESINELAGLFTSIVSMATAHEESAKKSWRLAAVWGEKRRNAGVTKMTARAPAWLRLAADRKSYEVIPERAKVVLQIYKDTLRGIGRFRITAKLRASGGEPWGEGKRKGTKWHSSYVAKILANEAVIGRFQPHKMAEEMKRVKVGDVLENYYPRVVPEDMFRQVQALKLGRPLMAGRVGKGLKNLFAHLAKCARTGKPALYFDKGQWQYIKSDGELPDGRKMKGWPYREFEALFLSSIGGLDLAAIFGEDRSDMDKARGAVATAEAAVAEIDRKIAKLLDSIEAEETPSPSAHARLKERELERVLCEEVVELARKDLGRTEQNSASARRATQTLHDLLSGPPDTTMRTALRAEIRRIVQRIDITFDIAESPKEREEREGIEAFAKKARKAGAKILLTADGVVPKRSFTIVFQNGVRRTAIEGKNGVPMVCEPDEHGTDFSSAVMLLSPNDSPPTKRSEPAPIVEAAAPKSAKAKKPAAKKPQKTK